MRIQDVFESSSSQECFVRLNYRPSDHRWENHDGDDGIVELKKECLRRGLELARVDADSDDEQPEHDSDGWDITVKGPRAALEKLIDDVWNEAAFEDPEDLKASIEPW